MGFNTRYRVWLADGATDLFAVEWSRFASQLSELGVVDGWLDINSKLPHVAILVWQDRECWEAYTQYCTDTEISNPVVSVSQQLVPGAVIGYEPE